MHKNMDGKPECLFCKRPYANFEALRSHCNKKHANTTKSGEDDVIARNRADKDGPDQVRDGGMGVDMNKARRVYPRGAVTVPFAGSDGSVDQELVNTLSRSPAPDRRSLTFTPSPKGPLAPTGGVSHYSLMQYCAATINPKSSGNKRSAEDLDTEEHSMPSKRSKGIKSTSRRTDAQEPGPPCSVASYSAHLPLSPRPNHSIIGIVSLQWSKLHLICAPKVVRSLRTKGGGMCTSIQMMASRLNERKYQVRVVSFYGIRPGVNLFALTAGAANNTSDDEIEDRSNQKSKYDTFLLLRLNLS